MEKNKVKFKEEFIEKLRQEFRLDPDDYNEFMLDFALLDYFQDFSIKSIIIGLKLSVLKDQYENSIEIPVSVELVDMMMDVSDFYSNLELITEEV